MFNEVWSQRATGSEATALEELPHAVVSRLEGFGILAVLYLLAESQRLPAASLLLNVVIHLCLVKKIPRSRVWQAAEGMGAVQVIKAGKSEKILKTALANGFVIIDALDAYEGLQSLLGTLSLDYSMFRNMFEQFNEVILPVDGDRLEEVLCGKYQVMVRMRAARDPTRTYGCGRYHIVPPPCQSACTTSARRQEWTPKKVALM